MDKALSQLVRERAGHVCEYCRMPQSFDALPFEIDHVVAEQHGGKSVLSNLALACFYDNRYKGPNLAGIDPTTGRKAPLFNPRRHKWNRHFSWRGAFVVGRTPVGRATIVTLRLNLPHRLKLREQLLVEEPWRALRIGDRIRIVRLPSHLARSWVQVTSETTNLYRYLISQRRVFSVDTIDQAGIPWISCRIREKEGTHHHSLALNDDSWVKLTNPRKR